MKLTLFHPKENTDLSAIEWTELMRRIRCGYWRDVVEQCRKEAVGSDELKKRLPAFGISVTFTGGDAAANMVRYNHLVGIDFNKVLPPDDNGMEKIDQCRDLCRGIPSVVGFYVTKSGRGFRVFVHVDTGIAEHKMIYHPLQEYFERLFDLQADDKYMDVTRLSFVSYDPDCFYRAVENAAPFVMSGIVPEIDEKCIRRETEKIDQQIADCVSGKYDFRYNKVSRRVEVRIKSDTGNAVPECLSWRDVDDRFNDVMVKYVNDELMTAVTYNQFKWVLDNYISKNTYDPVKDFDASLPDWDGRDHIGEYVSRLSAMEGMDIQTPFASWAVRMYKSLTTPSYQNQHILLLESLEKGSGKTSWIWSLFPEQLRRYVIATNVDFITDIGRYLLVVVEDYENGNLTKIKRMMDKNRHLSVAITTSRELDIHDRTVKMDRLLLHQKDEGELVAPIDYLKFYSQLKYMASK